MSSVFEDLTGLVGSEGQDVQADEDEFRKLAIDAREQHNVEQNIVVELPEAKGKSILCASAAHPSGSGRFFAPRQQLTYVVNHETLATSDLRPYKPNAHVESLRSQLQKYLSVYVEDRYLTGIVDVFAASLPRPEAPSEPEPEASIDPKETENASAQAEGTEIAARESLEELEEGQEVSEKAAEGEYMHISQSTEDAQDRGEDQVMEDAKKDEEPSIQGTLQAGMKEAAPKVSFKVDEESEGETKLVIHIVANQYKLSNFWAGRWRSTYTLSSSPATEMKGQVNVRVHYFEEGNVQLNSDKTEMLSPKIELSDEERAKSIVRAIEQFEAGYQEELFSSCQQLSEGAFRSLRRQLPMTKQKVDWDKVLNYKLGSELAE